MALGRPVIVSDLPPLRELVGDDERGIVIAPDSAPAMSQALTMLADDVARRGALAAAGKRFAATRTWGAAALEYDRTFTRLGGIDLPS
jgi:glycosyltransferase involved in cell wall biosynthesis